MHDEKVLHDIGKVVNAATGRGAFQSHEELGAALNTVFFAPRLMLSRINYLNPAWYVRLSKPARREALRGLFATAGGVMGGLELANQIPGVSVGLDPASADFGKIKVGDTRIDIAGGFQQYIRLAGELGTHTYESSTTGKRTDLLHPRFGEQSEWDVALGFLTNKANPLISLVHGLSAGKGQSGVSQQVYQHFVPLIVQDAIDLYRDPVHGMNGIEAAMGGYGLEAFGLGLQTYGKPQPKATSKYVDEAKKLGSPLSPKVAAEIDHKSHLDSISSAHPGDPKGALKDALKYYAEVTGDHQYDKFVPTSDDGARYALKRIRAMLQGTGPSGASAYETRIRKAWTAQKRKVTSCRS